MKRYKLAAVFLGIQILDCVSTYIAIKVFGSHEMNPIVRNSFQAIGLEATMGLKFLIAAGLALLYIELPWMQRSFRYSMTVGNIITAMAVISNISVVFAQIQNA